MTRGLKLVGLLLGTVVLGSLGMGAADTQPPVVDIETPSDGASYLLHEPVEVSWTAEDVFPGSGLKSAFATQADGDGLATSSPGEHVFTVVAEDHAGNRVQRQVRYWVVYDVVIEKPLAPSAFEGSTRPNMTISAGTEIPFSFTVRDFFERTVEVASGTISVLDADTREVVYLGDDGIGVLQFNSETETFDDTLDTGQLAAGEYEVLIQFNDGRTIFRIDLTLEPSESS